MTCICLIFLAFPVTLVFNETHSSKWLSNTSQPVVKAFECSTNSWPYYYKHLHIRNLFTNQIVSDDPSDNIYTAVTVKNEGHYHGKHVLTLFLNLTRAEDLKQHFQYFERDGIMHVFTAFDCSGLVKEIDNTTLDNKTFGHFDAAHLEVIYVHGRLHYRL